ncbi:MAG: helix-turn-helix domain-containing protein [Alphaproteobacteria bacterium]
MTSEQLRMARAALGWSIQQTSDYAGVSPNTIARAERGGTVNRSTVNALRLTYENAGVIFISENGEGPGVRLRKGGH